MEKGLVSVVMITYNQEAFLQQAISGVLIQNYLGKIELIIVDDCSPDNTHERIHGFIREATLPPNTRIRYSRNDVNKGVVGNFTHSLKLAKGEFIAICEGDDYWTDPMKLQKQVDYLNENIDCNLVYHRVMIYDEDTSTFSKEDLNLEDISTKRALGKLTLEGNFMHTPSVLIRNNVDYNSKLFKGTVGDYVLWYLSGKKGLYGYLPDYMAVYRVWDGGVWSKQKKAKTHFLFANLLINISKSEETPTLKDNLVQQALNSLNGIGFSDLSFYDKIKYSVFLLRHDPNSSKTLVKKIRNAVKLKSHRQ